MHRASSHLLYATVHVRGLFIRQQFTDIGCSSFCGLALMCASVTSLPRLPAERCSTFFELCDVACLLL